MSVSPTDDRSSSNTDSGNSNWDKALALSGIAFVGLFVLALVLQGVLASGTYPSPYESSDTITSWVSNSHDALRAQSILQSLAALALIPFTAAVASYLRRNGDEGGALSGLTLGGGVLASATMLLSALCAWILTRSAVEENVSVLRAVHDLAFMTGGPGHVMALSAVVGPGSIAALRTGMLPRWLSWLGLIAAAFSLLSAFALLLEEASVLLPIGRLLAAVWIVGVAIAFGRESRNSSTS